MSNREVTRYLAIEVKRMYDTKDKWGRRLHSQREVASHFGLGETTVFRIVNNYGSYMDIPEPAAPEVLEAEARASAARLFNPDGTLKAADVPARPAVDYVKLREAANGGEARLAEELARIGAADALLDAMQAPPAQGPGSTPAGAAPLPGGGPSGVPPADPLDEEEGPKP